MKPSKSPDRHSFQKEGYVERMKEKGEEPNQDYLDMFQKILEEADLKWQTPESKIDNMEYDLVTTDWILEKVRASESYAQNLYAAICNNDFQKLAVVPILSNKTWSASWRSAGGIVADMRQEGDYIDWYCSGIRNDNNYDPELNIKFPNGYVPEKVVTDEIREDLKRLAWIVVDQNDEF
jgi:hypothetical protein